MNIVITGSTRGIGHGLSTEFLKAGHNVLINGRNKETTSAVLKKFQDLFPDRKIASYSCDVSKFDDVLNMYNFGEEQFGSIDIWINNAGINQEHQLIYNLIPSELGNIIDINIKGVVNGTRVASEKMMKNGGFIYNMEGFGSDDMISERMSLYGMTKRALTYFTKSTAREVKKTKVRICRLSPGMVITDLLLSSLPEDQEIQKRYKKIYNILGDTVETVTPYLVSKILKNKKNDIKIAWLTKPKAFKRFFLSIFVKRKLI